MKANDPSSQQLVKIPQKNFEEQKERRGGEMKELRIRKRRWVLAPIP